VFIYVIPFYLSSATRPSPTLTRDAPSSIRARTRAVTFSTIVCSVLTVYVLYEHDVPAMEIVKLLGLWPVSYRYRADNASGDDPVRRASL
jgi:prenyl protein peptidase